jgi:hypothetical protein
MDLNFSRNSSTDRCNLNFSNIQNEPIKPVPQMVYSESCENLQTNSNSIFKSKMNSWKVTKKSGHMHKRSISGKPIRLIGSRDDGFRGKKDNILSF